MNLRAVFTVSLAALLASASASAPASTPAGFDPQEIRDATTKLIAALEDPDPTAWVYAYTEDATLLEAGSPPLQGRAALLELAGSMAPMSEVSLSIDRIEGSGHLAYLSGSGAWTSGRTPETVATTRVRLLIVWRKEADGQWRVAQEVLVPITP